ncbi:MAG: hypothetical protein KY454_00475 [Actinobacteria bacterium]|nr:hypothetical protein [Actinomycetota bacterium]MBW3650486.1 hypothetical protein [Actinomycetota bacterium]
MPRRIDVELTSARSDGTWTWRAAGAREPKGVLPADLLYAGAKVGDVAKAEADFDIDGITILSVTAPKSKAQPANLIEVTGPARAFEPVTTSLVPKREAPRRDRDRPDGDRPPQDRRPRPAGERGPRPQGERGPRGEGERGNRPQGDRGRPRPPRDSTTGAGGTSADRRPRPPRVDRGATGPRASRPAERPEPTPKPRPKRLSPSNRHRSAVVESLSPEQRPVAEQVLRGGIPALRRAIEEQNAQARTEGRPEVKGEALVALAEELLPRLKTAEWHDRAEAAMADVDEIGLRDLRSVVSGADAAARDDETRRLAVSLREALERRLKEQQDQWTTEITTTLDDGRLVRALRIASRTPDPSMRLPAELALRLAGAASEAMGADTPPERWLALLEAVAASPVRTTVKPAALPNDPGEPLLHVARQHAGRIPALTTLLGISMPPPPGPARPRPSRPAGGPPRPIPPPPRPVATQPADPSPADQAGPVS